MILYATSSNDILTSPSLEKHSVETFYRNQLEVQIKYQIEIYRKTESSKGVFPNFQHKIMEDQRS